jgi:hypothetical protein
VIAGKGADIVETTLNSVGSRIVLGDEGQLNYDTNNLLQSAQSTSTEGGNDTITLHDGDNIIIGGYGADSITTSDGSDVILGDTGSLQFSGGLLAKATSVGVNGAADIVTTGEGNKIVLSGAGDDEITLGNGNSDVVSDNGILDYANQVFSVDNSVSGDDVIVAGEGDHRILAGNGSDSITLGAGNNTIIADTGSVDEAAQTATADALGNGADVIVVGNGDNRILAGDGSDSITTGAGNNDILADTGTFDYAAGIFTADENGTGDDVIITGLGDQRILGGYGVDSITTVDGNNIILGDTGSLEYFDSELIQVIAEGLYGAADTIITGDGDNIVLSGSGDDNIITGSGFDRVFGDNGFIQFDGDSYLLSGQASTTDGNDVIQISGDYNIVFGGNGDDSIKADKNAKVSKNILIGDSADISYANGDFVITQKTNGEGGDDIIQGTGILLGGDGNNEYTIGEGIYSDTLEDITLTVSDNGTFFTLPFSATAPSQVGETSEIAQDLVFNSDFSSFDSNTENEISSSSNSNILRKALLDFEVRNIKAMSNEQLRDFLRSLPIETSRKTALEIEDASSVSVSKQFDDIEQSPAFALLYNYRRLTSLIDNVEYDLYASNGNVQELETEIVEASEAAKEAEDKFKRDPSVLNSEGYTNKNAVYTQLLEELNALKEELEVLLEQHDNELDDVKDGMGISQSLVLLAMSRPSWQLNSLKNVGDSKSMTPKKRSFSHWKR